jgi:hypothetical protein
MRAQNRARRAGSSASKVTVKSREDTTAQ